ncbi:unnamed protein product [Orchesella dallaii]|uniref:CUB domain-containing protein n=1 Tax=Orchesella dallaii TaxID=48710 RepID=A0ABP1Q7L0_9HEXA
MASTNIILCFTSLLLLLLQIYADPISPYASNCGEILSGEAGGISYKPFELSNVAERCIWVLRVPRATSYNVVLYNKGTSASDKVIATALSQDKPEVHTLLSVVDTSYSVNGSVAVITFYAYRGTGTSTGFSLYYDAVLNETNPVSPYSTDYVISANETEILYPRIGGVYANNELSTFIFTPNFQYLLNQRVTVNVTVLGMEQNCDDLLTVYQLPAIPSSNPTWMKLGRICGVDNQVALSNSDVIMLVFQSDESYVSSGFRLSCKLN